MESLVFWVIAGCVLGIFTGLMPGIHVNTLSIIAAGLAGKENLGIALMIVAMAIVHSFMDFIPSILLGAPDSENFLAMLPGHRMFAKGKALLAIKLTVIGGMAAGILSLLLAPLFFLFFSKTAESTAMLIPFGIIGVIALMLHSEKNKPWGIAVMLLSGALGMIVLNSSMQLNEPLFPLITGFFGISSIVQSILSKQKAREQENSKHGVPTQQLLFGSVASVACGMLVAVLPSIGASQAAFIVKSIVGKIRTHTYLIVLGGISTANTIFAFFALFALGKTRSGTAAALRQLIETNNESLLLVIATMAAAMGVGAIAAILVSGMAIKKIDKIDYKKLNLAVLALLFVLTIIISGIAGIIVLIAASGIGLTAVFSGTRRTNCMAFLMLPTLLFYLTHYYSI